MPLTEIECLWECNDGIGKSPIYHEDEDALYWSDQAEASIEAPGNYTPAIRRLNLATGENTSWEMPEQIGSFTFCHNGEMIAGTNSGFQRVDLENGLLYKISVPGSNNPKSRLNDGKVDRLGRYWCGSVKTTRQEESSSIYRLDHDGSVHSCEQGFHFLCINGIAFSPDNKLMYFGDAKAGVIYVFDFDLEAGIIKSRREFHSIKSQREGIIGGSTVDAEGFYWFALNMGGRIIRLDPKGRLAKEIKLPITSPTSLTFGGSNYETLFVTSQQSFVHEEPIDINPKAGSIFAIHNIGIRGLPEPLFGKQ